MRKIIFATNNKHKLKEVKELLKGTVEVLGLDEAGVQEDVPETADTLEGNALQKARYINNKLNVDCFADDTGLEVNALDGAPGVYSARYAGPQRSAADNIVKLLAELKGETNRKAQFKTVIALIQNGEEYVFEGVVKGEITTSKCGSEGFGYDPVFRPDGSELTFAEMSLEEKNNVSHRAAAVQKLVQFLQNTFE